MKRYIAAALSALLVVMGLVGLSSSASAHTGGVSGVAVCETDGTYTVTWTYTASNVPAGTEAETKAMTTNQGQLAVLDGVLKGGQVFLSVWTEHQINVPGVPVKKGNWSAQFKTVNVPGNYSGNVTTMVQTDWKNGPSEDPVGSVKVDGKCKNTPPPDTSDHKIVVCHANEGVKNYTRNEVSKASFYEGHRVHEGDIYPAGSYEKGNQTYSWPAQGDQSLLLTDCVKPTPPPTPTPEPTEEPTPTPTPEPTVTPTPEPTEEPTEEPTPTPEPTEEPTPEPTEEPTPEPTEEPTPEPTEEPTPEPTPDPTEPTPTQPTVTPTTTPSAAPVVKPTPRQWVCSDFDTQEAAQTAYLDGKKYLDADGDGIACESSQISLAATGLNMGHGIGVAVVLLALGTIGVLTARRRRQLI